MKKSDLELAVEGIAIEYDPSLEQLLIGSPQNPDRLLWLSVIFSAFEDLGLMKREEPRKIDMEDYIDARDWVLDKRKDSDFNYVCFLADVCPQKIRRILAKKRCKCCNVLVLSKPCKRNIK